MHVRNIQPLVSFRYQDKVWKGQVEETAYCCKGRYINAQMQYNTAQYNISLINPRGLMNVLVAEMIISK